MNTIVVEFNDSHFLPNQDTIGVFHSYTRRIDGHAIRKYFKYERVNNRLYQDEFPDLRSLFFPQDIDSRNYRELALILESRLSITSSCVVELKLKDLSNDLLKKGSFIHSYPGILHGHYYTVKHMINEKKINIAFPDSIFNYTMMIQYMKPIFKRVQYLMDEVNGVGFEGETIF